MSVFYTEVKSLFTNQTPPRLTAKYQPYIKDHTTLVRLRDMQKESGMEADHFGWERINYYSISMQMMR